MSAKPSADEKFESEYANDPRWILANKIAASRAFRKSSRLPGLFLFLARYTIMGDQHRLTEQLIGQAVFGKRQYFDPSEDSSVRVNVRQLRLKLHEYYQTPALEEELLVTLPKGGYALDFAPLHPATVAKEPAAAIFEAEPIRKRSRLAWVFGSISAVLLGTTLVCAVGWHHARSTHEGTTPWPLNVVVHQGQPTTLIVADVGTTLRMLGDQELTLDSYIKHSYVQPLLPKHMSDGEASLFRYLDNARITSVADANAAAVLSSVAGPLSENISVRSARDVNAIDLTHGDFIFIGSQASNPWAELVETRMGFQISESSPHGQRYILNRHGLPGEQATYTPQTVATLASGDDYAIIALVPAKTGSGNWLIFEGIRMEGTNAAISMMKNPAFLARIYEKLSALNHGQQQGYFEALLHSQSVAGATMSVDVVAVHPITIGNGSR